MSLQSAVNRTIGSIGAAHVAKTQKAEKAAREQEKLSKQAPSVKKLRYSQQVKQAALNRVQIEKDFITPVRKKLVWNKESGTWQK